MKGSERKRVSWGSVALGWLMALLAGVVISLLLRALYGFVVSEPPAEGGEFTATVVVISLVSGFLAYLVGGYVAARLARYSGGKHGALTAVFGLIVGIILAVFLALFGAIFGGGVAVPPANFGIAGGDLLAALILFFVNLFGGYVGGKLGEPPGPGIQRRG